MFSGGEGPWENDPNADGWLGRGAAYLSKDDQDHAIADFSEIVTER